MARRSQPVRRAPHAKSTPIQHVGVDHRRTDIRMSEQFLNRSNVVSILEQMRCKGMAEGVATDSLRDPCPPDRARDRALHHRFVQMIARRWSKSRVSADACRGKHELPARVNGRVWIFLVERARQNDAAQTVGKIMLVLAAHIGEMHLQRPLHAPRKHGATVLLPFSTSDHDLIAIEIHVLDVQFERLLEPEAGPVEQRHDQPRCTGQLIQHHAHLVNAEDHRHPRRAMCVRHVIDRARIEMEHVTIQEQQRAECLILC
jgi:hypothetical protein